MGRSKSRESEKEISLFVSVFKSLTYIASLLMRDERLGNNIDRVIVAIPSKKLTSDTVEGYFQAYIEIELDNRTIVPYIRVEGSQKELNYILEDAEDKYTKIFRLSPQDDDRRNSGDSYYNRLVDKIENNFESEYGNSFENAFSTKVGFLDVMNSAISEVLDLFNDYVEESDRDEILYDDESFSDFIKNGRRFEFNNGLRIDVKKVSRDSHVDFNVGFSQAILRAAKNDKIFD